MKNSIQIIAIALLSFSNVVSASGLIKKIDLINDSKTVQAKMVSYANSDLLQEEIAGLQTYSITVSDVINLDLKITENEHDFKTCFVNYANQDLLTAEIQIEKTATTIEYQIKNDLTITESSVKVAEKLNFVHFYDQSLLHFELDSFKNTTILMDEIIAKDSKIIESSISKQKKLSINKVGTFTKLIQN